MEAIVYIPVLLVDCSAMLPTAFAYTTDPQPTEEKAREAVKEAMLSEYRTYHENNEEEPPEPEFEEQQYTGELMLLLGDEGWVRGEVNRRKVTL